MLPKNTLLEQKRKCVLACVAWPEHSKAAAEWQSLAY